MRGVQVLTGKFRTDGVNYSEGRICALYTEVQKREETGSQRRRRREGRMKDNGFYGTILLFLLLGCSTHETRDEGILTGRIEKRMLEDRYPWFEKNYNAYTVDEGKVSLIQQRKAGVSAIIFLGTWCGDSKREVPRFYKVIEKAGFVAFEVYGLDRKKKTPDGVEAPYGIERVPTFIFFKDGREIGRIIETPEKTIEEDIAKILSRS